MLYKTRRQPENNVPWEGPRDTSSLGIKEVQVLYTENYSEETDAEPLIWHHSLRRLTGSLVASQIYQALSSFPNFLRDTVQCKCFPLDFIPLSFISLSTALQSCVSRHCHFLWYSHVGQEHHSKQLHCSALTNLYCVPHGRFTRDLTEFPPTTLPR